MYYKLIEKLKLSIMSKLITRASKAKKQLESINPNKKVFILVLEDDPGVNLVNLEQIQTLVQEELNKQFERLVHETPAYAYFLASDYF